MNTNLLELENQTAPEGLQALSELMNERGIRPSYQRLRILDFLNKHRTHPTADQIYSYLQREIPSLSKTTVYNSLNALTECGLVRTLPLDENESHYDIDVKPHGHFKCNHCKEIIDFDFDLHEAFVKQLKGFQVETEFLLVTGICNQCINHCEPEAPA